MVNRKKTQKELEAELEETKERLKEFENDDEQGEELPADIACIAEEIGGASFKIIVERYNDDNFLEKIGTFPADQFNSDAIAQKFNGGRFKFTIRNERGHYVKQYQKTYAKPARADVPERKDDTTKEMISLLKQQSTQAQDDAKNMFRCMTEMMTKVMELQMNQANRPAVERNVLDDLVKFKSLIAEKSTAVDDISKILEFMQTGIKIGKDMNLATGDADPEKLLINKLIDHFGGAIPELLSKIASVSGNRAPGNVVNGQVIPPTVPVIPAVPEKREEKMNYRTETERKVIGTLKTNREALINGAKLGLEHSIVVNAVLNKLSEADLDLLYDYYGSTDGNDNFARTFEFIPEFREYSDWLAKLLELIIKETEPLSEGENNAVRGNEGNQDGNADGNNA